MEFLTTCNGTSGTLDPTVTTTGKERARGFSHWLFNILVVISTLGVLARTSDVGSALVGKGLGYVESTWYLVSI